MEDLAQFIKSLIRPFIIVWGFTLYSVCILTNMEVPTILAGLVSVVSIEYFGERAVKRFREK